MEEEESCPDRMFGCSLDLHLCTGTQLHSQTRKYVHSQCGCDLAKKMVTEKNEIT